MWVPSWWPLLTRRPNPLLRNRPAPHQQYKRQLLNVLGIIYRYDRIKRMPAGERRNVVPRICVIGGKVRGVRRAGTWLTRGRVSSWLRCLAWHGLLNTAGNRVFYSRLFRPPLLCSTQAAPGYERAKRIIKLVSAVADKVRPAWLLGCAVGGSASPDLAWAPLRVVLCWVAAPQSASFRSCPMGPPTLFSPPGEQRPRGGRPAQGGVCARLQRQPGRDHHPRHRAQVGSRAGSNDHAA